MEPQLVTEVYGLTSLDSFLNPRGHRHGYEHTLETVWEHTLANPVKGGPFNTTIDGRLVKFFDQELFLRFTSENFREQEEFIVKAYSFFLERAVTKLRIWVDWTGNNKRREIQISVNNVPKRDTAEWVEIRLLTPTS